MRFGSYIILVSVSDIGDRERQEGGRENESMKLFEELRELKVQGGQTGHMHKTVLKCKCNGGYYDAKSQIMNLLSNGILYLCIICFNKKDFRT